MIDELLEQFNLDPLEEYDTLLEDGTEEMLSYIREAQTGTTKKNIFQKLIDLIVKIGGWIVKWWKKFIGWIKDIFKRKAKTSNQILESLSLVSDKSSFDSDGISSITPLPNGLEKVSFQVKSVDENGTIITKEDAMNCANGIIMKIENDRVAVMISHGFDGSLHAKAAKFVGDGTDDMEFQNTKNNAPKQPIANANGILDGFKISIAILDDESLMKSLLDMADKIAQKPTDDETINSLVAESENFLKIAYKATGVDLRSGLYIAMSGLEKINNAVIKISDSIVSYKSIENPSEKMVALLNNVSHIMIYLQFGLNFMTGTLGNFYDVDVKFHHCVKDTKTLDMVVNEFIRAHIPSKFIARNVYFLCSNDLCEYSDIDHPAFGQSRMALYPPKDNKVVYKVALNGMGIHDNKTDAATYGRLKGTSYSVYLAAIKSLESLGCVQTMERTLGNAQSKKRSSFNSDFAKLSKMLDTMAEKTGIEIHDRGEHNTGYIGDRLVLFDYGQTSSSSSQSANS